MSSIIAHNESAGILCSYNSNPVIIESSISDTWDHGSTYYGGENPEIKLYSDCFPILERNDIIFGDGYSLLNFDPSPESYDC